LFSIYIKQNLTMFISYYTYQPEATMTAREQKARVIWVDVHV